MKIIYFLLIPLFAFFTFMDCANSQGRGDFIEIVSRTNDTLINADTIVYDFDYDFVSEWGAFITFQTQRAGGSGADTVIVETFTSNTKPKGSAIWVLERADTLLGTATQLKILAHDVKGRRLRYLIRKTTASKSTRVYFEGVLRRKKY